MKIRQGFVSNSSSSSFVVISKNGEDQTEEFLEPENAFDTLGNMEFTYSRRYYDVFSKINFAWLMTEYMGHLDLTQEECRDKIIKLLESKGSGFYYKYVLKGYIQNHGYIDHGNECVDYKLFEGDNLENFIFNSESYVETERL